MDRKIEIETKLDKERANLDLLKERIDKSSQITKNIDTILNTFEQRLLRLEDTILPVYNETENLQKSQHCIEETLEKLDNVISYYEVSGKVEDIIERGPGVGAGTDLDMYIESMEQLAKAREYFGRHIPRSVELENVLALHKSGADQLHSEFKSLLDRHTKPLLPVALLNYMQKMDAQDQVLEQGLDDVVDGNGMDGVIVYPAHVRQDLRRISAWLLANERTAYLNVYATVRGSALCRTLAALRTYQRTVSGGSSTGGNTSGTSDLAMTSSVGQQLAPIPGSPMPSGKFHNRQHEMRRPAPRRSINQMLEEKANRMLARASQTLGQSTGLTLGPRRSHAPNFGNELYAHGHGHSPDDLLLDNEQEMENYLVCVIALHRLMQLELRLMQDQGSIVVDSNHQEKVFEMIVKESMDAIVQDGENIAARARRCISRHEFSAVLVIFPILKQLLSLKPEFERTVNRETSSSSSSIALTKFNTILGTLHNTGVKALEEFVESLRSDSITQLPRDGTVHEVTSNVLIFLEQLLEYIEPIGGVLAHDPTYSAHLQRLNLKGNVDRNKALLGLYIKKVLVQLNHTISSKSEQYGDPALRSIFRLNNTYYVLKALQPNKLLDLYRICDPNCEDYYHRAIVSHKSAYLESWNKLLGYIAIDDAVNMLRLKDSQFIKDKDRSVIKEKFAGFNKEIDDITKVQRGYSIPDVEVRESLKRDNKEHIIPKYNTFYNKFNGINFTKNPEKYIKYKPDEIATIIDKFFDVAA